MNLYTYTTFYSLHAHVNLLIQITIHFPNIQQKVTNEIFGYIQVWIGDSFVQIGFKSSFYYHSICNCDWREKSLWQPNDKEIHGHQLSFSTSRSWAVVQPLS